jgi:hypothetical protein
MFPNRSEARWHIRYEREIHIGKTNKHGTVKYCLPDPPPKTFILSFYQFTGPDPRVQDFDLGQVLQTGVFAQTGTPTPQLKDDASVKPGEIVVFGKRWNLIERYLPPLPVPDLP